MLYTVGDFPVNAFSAPSVCRSLNICRIPDVHQVSGTWLGYRDVRRVKYRPIQPGFCFDLCERLVNGFTAI